jgi:tetratricopeptide (TPR) repeat protein
MTILSHPISRRKFSDAAVFHHFFMIRQQQMLHQRVSLRSFEVSAIAETTSTKTKTSSDPVDGTSGSNSSNIYDEYRHLRKELEDRLHNSRNSSNDNESTEEENGLTIPQQRLVEALQQQQRDGDGDGETMPVGLLSSLERLRDGFEGVEYYADALRVEEAIYQHQQTMIEEENAEEELVVKSGAKKSTALVDSLYRQANLKMRLGRYGPAEHLYREALVGLTGPATVSRTPGSAATNNNISSTSRSTTITSRDDRRARFLLGLAGALFHRQLIDEALPYLQQAEACSDSSEVRVKCWQHLGLLHRTMQDFQSALQMYQNALAATVSTVEPAQRQRLQLDVADMHLALEQDEQAMELYQAILAENSGGGGEGEDSGAVEAVLRHNMGRIYANGGDLDRAAQSLRTSISIKRRNDAVNPDLVKSLSSLGAVYARQEKRGEALECFQEALLLARASGADVGEIMLYMRNIALVRGESVEKWQDHDDSTPSTSSSPQGRCKADNWDDGDYDDEEGNDDVTSK